MPSDTSVRDSAQKQLNVDTGTVDTEREAARRAIDKMNTFSEPFAKITSTIGQADPISLMNSVSSFLKLLERFNSIVDDIAEV